ncbi:MAG: PIN domain nuclease [Phycisphaerales bacterium]
MILVDSSVWIDYFNGKTTGQTDLLNVLLDQELILTGDLVVAEVLQGFKEDREFNKARDLLDTLICKDMLGKNLAVKSAQNYRLLRRKGVTTRKTIDVIIATFCVQNRMVLLHNDRDFELMAEHLGLQTITWMDPAKD